MKYGSQLNRRSVPEWRGHNILYSEIKQEIKDLTSGEWDAERYSALEQLFYDELSNVSLFVVSKMSEVQHRIAVCQQLVDEEAASAEKNAGANNDSRQSADTNDHMYQLHRETAKLTGDIQKLSRFIGAQYTGFKKLIKKYRRHSNGQGLVDFERTLDAPNSFVHTDFTPCILELSLLYDVIRSRKFTSLKPLTSGLTGTASEKSLADKLVLFDIELLRYPTSRIRRFWIHPDHLVEAKVVLLQHTSMVVPESEAQCGTTDVLYLDTHQFEYAQLVKDPGQIVQVTIGNDASRVILSAPTGGVRGTTAYELSEQQKDEILHSSVSNTDISELDVAGRLALGWIVKRQVHVATETRSRRTRFKSDNMLVALDSNIEVCGSRGPQFPYAVLEIRSADSSSSQQLIDALTTTNLAYPVSELFSLYAFALIRSRPQFSVKPRWLETLDQGVDIRQPPPDQELRHSKSHSDLRQRPSQGILLLDSREIGDADGNENGPSPYRYWNEFDDGDEDQDDAFAIFVGSDDEDARRAQTAARLSRPVLALGNSVRRKLDSIRSYLSTDNDDRRSNGALDETSSESTIIGPDNPGQYSPRIRAQYDSEACIDPLSSDARRSDLALAFITFVCMSMSLALTGAILGILTAEDLSLLNVYVQFILASGLMFAVLLSAAGLAAYSIRQAQDWRVQVLVQAVFLSVVCFGVGGVVLIMAPLELSATIRELYNSQTI